MKQINNSTKNVEYLRKNSGATSIFVILMMVVLFVFGLAALTTSLAALKLSQKNAVWSDEYYVVEAQAEKTLAEIDRLLFQAEKVSRTYFIDKNFASESTTSPIPNDYIEKRMQMIYWFEALRLLSTDAQRLGITIESQGIDEMLSIDNVDSVRMWVSYTVVEAKQDYPKNITVVLNMAAPGYNIGYAQGSYNATRDTLQLKRYQILQWQEWQNQFVYDNAIDFEDPVFENPEFNNVDESGSNEDSDTAADQGEEALFIPVE